MKMTSSSNVIHCFLVCNISFSVILVSDSTKDDEEDYMMNESNHQSIYLTILDFLVCDYLVKFFFFVMDHVEM